MAKGKSKLSVYKWRPMSQLFDRCAPIQLPKNIDLPPRKFFIVLHFYNKVSKKLTKIGGFFKAIITILLEHHTIITIAIEC